MSEKKSNPAQKGQKSSTTNKTANSFIKQLTQALRMFNNPAGLAENSPLATPYFLGDYLHRALAREEDEVVARGIALNSLVLDAAKAVSKQNEEWGKLLALRFLSDRPKSTQKLINQNLLGMPRTTYFRQQKAAIEQLAREMIQKLQPALRIEAPATVERMVGRDAVKVDCLSRLQQGEAIGLIGPGGIGKTTLGVDLANSVAPGAVFWFTFYPGLNDRLSNILFALGYFLHRQGAPNLWLQLVADKGEIREDVVLNLLRHDLESLAGDRLVLCFDEVDLLHPDEIAVHRQLLRFLESLRGLAPLILIGQKRVVETDYRHHLKGLSASAIEQLVIQANIRLNGNTLDNLQQYTQGNPRLVELFVALYHLMDRSGETPADALSILAQEPAVESLLRRIWRHLNAAEKHLIEVLAVFRRSAPRRAWPNEGEQEAIEQLSDWRLAQVDGQDGVVMLLAFREAIYNLLPAEGKEKLHLSAANIRAKYGQYTAAAHHCLKGGKPQWAVRLWQVYKEQEINQGQAETALSILEAVSPGRLRPNDRQRLAYLRAELQKVAGNYDQAQETLQSVRWRIPFLKVQAKRLEGDIAELKGIVRQAVRAYQIGVETVEKWLAESAKFRRDIGYVHLHQREFDQAEREVLKIRYEAANLDGLVHERKGELNQARSNYLEAIDLAAQAQYAYGEANTHSNLGALLAWQRNVEQARFHLEKASRFFRRTGRLNNLASVTFNLAFAYRLADRYREAIAPAEKALQLFTQMGEPFGRAVALQILAEVYLAVGDLSKAEQFAYQVIQAEEANTFPDALRTLGEVRLQQGVLDEAANLIRQSIEIAAKNQDAILVGYGWRALGEVYIAQGKPEEATQALETAAETFEESEMTEEAEKTRQILDKSDES